MDRVPIGALFGALAVLLVCSAFFSISETAMMALNRYRLRHLAQKGQRGARLAARLLANTDKLLSVILLGNNLVNMAAAALVTVLTIRLYGDGELAVSLATLLLTVIVLIFCEITPKVIAASHPEPIAFTASYLLTPLLKIVYPLVWVLNLAVRGLLWLLRVRQPADGPPRLSMEELRTLVLEAGKYIPQKHQSILVNLFELEGIRVDDVMVPRSHIEAVDLDAPMEKIKDQVSTSYHTRLLVYRGELDSIVGILHARRVLNLFNDPGTTSDDLARVSQTPYFVPSGTPLLTQLHQFQENQQRLGLVVDEYGELQGLITVEDILEEIVGEFTTHSPAAAGGFTRLEDGSYLVEGATTLRELNRKLGFALPLDGPRTLNGLILEHFQDIPEAGTSVKIGDQPMEIVQTQDRAVRMVRVFPPLPKDTDRPLADAEH
ncbi:MAG: HlyC/CorC family transporter [Pseudomonadota bacterium]